MANIVINKTAFLDAPITVDSLHGMTFTNENGAHQFVISAMQGGNPLALTGGVSARFMRANSTTILLAGSVTNGKAVITLHQDCYNVPGRFQLAIFNTASGTTTCIYAAIGTVQRTVAGELIDSGEAVPDISDLLAQIDACEQATAAANAAATKAVRYDTAQTLTDAQKAQARTNINGASTDDVDNLRSDLNVSQNQITAIQDVVFQNAIISISPLRKGYFEASGYGGIGTHPRLLVSRVFSPGTYTFTPPSGWVSEYYQYVSDAGGTMISSFSANEKEIDSESPFVVTSRKSDNTTYTDTEYNSFVSGYTIVKHNGTNNLTARMDSAENAIEALETNVAGLHTELVADINEIKGIFNPTLFVRGDYNTSGSPIERNYTVRTADVMSFSEDTCISVADGFSGAIFVYPAGGTMYRTILNGFVVPKNTEVKFDIVRVNPDTTEVADVNTFVSAVTYKTSTISTDNISYASESIIEERYAHIVYTELLSEIRTIGTVSDALRASLDYSVRYHGMPYSIKMLTGASGNSDLRITPQTAISVAGVQEFDVCLYIEDVSAISSIRFMLPSASATEMSKLPQETLRNGWNHLRYLVEGTKASTSVSYTSLQIRASTTASTNIWLGSVVMVAPEKANVMVIADGPYYTFFTQAYPSLKAMGVPVIWALDPGLITESTAPDRQLINFADLDTLAMDGISEFSFHCYNTDILMSEATAQEALADTLKCVRFLKQKGLEPDRIWRAAWLQNNCPNHHLADQVVDASASYEVLNGVTTFPFIDRYNIPRTSIHSKTETQLDNVFAKLEQQHCTVLFYAHGVSSGSERELDPAMLTYFLNKLQAGITGGYINPTTYNMMMNYYAKLK